LHIGTKGGLFGGVIAGLLTAGPLASAQPNADEPWRRPDAIILIDPYAGNAINWAKVKTDPHVRGVIHRASLGMTPDAAFVARAAEATKRGLLYGAFHLGRPGDPVGQAELLLSQAGQAGVKFLAASCRPFRQDSHLCTTRKAGNPPEGLDVF
jgi:hypothetical protein